MKKSNRWTDDKKTKLDTQRHYRYGLHDCNLVYGKYINTDDSAYNDHMIEWNHDNYTAACAKANESATPQTAEWYEAFLKAYYKRDDIALVYVASGINRSNGYPYNVYGWNILRPTE